MRGVILLKNFTLPFEPKFYAIAAIHRNGMMLASAPLLAVYQNAAAQAGMTIPEIADLETSDERRTSVEGILSLGRYAELTQVVMVHSHVEAAFCDLAALVVETMPDRLYPRTDEKTFSLADIKQQSLAQLQELAFEAWLKKFNYSTLASKISILIGVLGGADGVDIPVGYDAARVVDADEFRQRIVHNPVSAGRENGSVDPNMHSDSLRAAFDYVFSVAEKHFKKS